MEAPEKLYVDVRDNLDDSFLYGFTKKIGDEDIEYTRTDALIEKASKWIIENYHDYDHRDEFDVKGLVLDFKEYMKGE